MTAAHIEYPDRTNLLGRQLPNIWHVGNRLLHNQCGNDIERSNPIRMLIVRAKPSDGHVQLPAVSYRKLERIIKESVYCQRLRLEENVQLLCATRTVLRARWFNTSPVTIATQSTLQADHIVTMRT